MGEKREMRARYPAVRVFLQVSGPIMIVVGLVLIIVGLADFAGPRTPLYVFTGMPLLFLGGVMSMFGYMGGVSRYQAGEVASVTRDAFGYPAEGTQAGVRKVAGAVAEGLSAGVKDSSGAAVCCSSCGRRNEFDARFCDKCGAPLKGRSCPSCSKVNAPDAQFCNNCGGGLE